MIITEFHDDFIENKVNGKVADMMPLLRKDSEKKIRNTLACLAFLEASL